ncbi:MAG: phosphoenolpyruvate-utilizing N-terminal domain-containing protein, partial [Pseudomonadota bacterium]
MSFALHGFAVSPGIAIGHAHLVSHATLEVAQYQVRERDIEAELARFDGALATVRSELAQLMTEAEASPGAAAELSAFVDLQSMFLVDPLLTTAPRALIRERRCNAEWALVQQMEQLVAR